MTTSNAINAGYREIRDARRSSPTAPRNATSASIPIPTGSTCNAGPGDHLGFGAGRHACVGMNLARMEMLAPFTALAERVLASRSRRPNPSCTTSSAGSGLSGSGGADPGKGTPQRARITSPAPVSGLSRSTTLTLDLKVQFRLPTVARGAAPHARWTELPTPTPGHGEVLVQVAVAGVNYMDVGARSVAIGSGLCRPSWVSRGRAGSSGWAPGCRGSRWDSGSRGCTTRAATRSTPPFPLPHWWRRLTASTTRRPPAQRPSRRRCRRCATTGPWPSTGRSWAARRCAPPDLLKSVRLTCPVFAHHVRTREALVARTSEVFELVETGRLRVRVGGRYPLSEAATAHTDIESRRTTGKLLLIPS